MHTLKTKPEVASESHTSVKDIFGYKGGYLHPANGPRAIFPLSNVLQTFLHLCDFICTNVVC